MPSRRNVLRRATTAALVGLAGCLEDVRRRDDAEPSFPSRWEYPIASARFGHQSGSSLLLAASDTDVFDRTLVALDPDTGDPEWTVPGESDDRHAIQEFTSSDPSIAPPAVSDGTAYVVTDGNHCVALEVSTGALEWETAVSEDASTSCTGSVSGQPITVRDLVCVAVAAGNDEWTIVALEADSGDDRFTYNLEGAPTCLPGGDDDSLVIAVNDGTIESITTHGDRRWTTSNAGRIVGFAVGDETVYAGGVDGTVRALDRSDGTERWALDRETTTAEPVVVDRTVFLGTTEELLAVSPDGQLRWQESLDTAPTAVAASDDHVLAVRGTEQCHTPAAVSAYPHVVTIHDRETGSRLHEYEYDGDESRPVAAVELEGELYLSNGSFVSSFDTG